MEWRTFSTHKKRQPLKHLQLLRRNEDLRYPHHTLSLHVFSGIRAGGQGRYSEYYYARADYVEKRLRMYAVDVLNDAIASIPDAQLTMEKRV